MKLVKVVIVAGLVLACCLGCDSGNTNTCIANQGGVTNCGQGSAIGGEKPSTIPSTYSPASSPTPAVTTSTPAAVSSNCGPGREQRANYGVPQQS